ncbi:MAG: c-type cytochrome biogenesis protein CcmI [Betaproteobacteria bacterium RIFCSPLOWO2_02_FULL_66_14]|nr:MAG: c-type cytochrome biogenesis protein CcmI [Betaproteobacteria bacterium RIFCSPLOWO2_02_FULL_66_14]
MTTFVLAAAFMTVLTLALLVVPLVRKSVVRRGATQADASVAVLRDQLEDLERDRASGAIDAAAFEAAERNLKLRILQDTAPEAAITDRRYFTPVVIIGLLIPLASAGLYYRLGTPLALDPALAAAEAQGQHADTAQLDTAVARLAQRLEAAPDDPQGWEMLARSYRVLGQHDKAAAAFARAEKHIASDPQRLTEWSESLAIVGGGKLAGKPAQLIARALAVDPDFGHALALAGAEAFERQDFKGAIGHWERLAKQFEAGSEQGETVARSIAAAREEITKAGGTPPAAAAKAEVPAPKAVAKSAAAATAQAATAPPAKESGVKFKLAGQVSLAPSLAAKTSPEDTVYIFARAAEGPAMPVAVLRKRAGDLPVSFTLDDSSAMMAQAQLASIGDLVVGARISRSGNAVPQSGDLQGLSRPVKVGATGIRVVIDAALP